MVAVSEVNVFVARNRKNWTVSYYSFLYVRYFEREKVLMASIALDTNQFLTFI